MQQRLLPFTLLMLVLFVGATAVARAQPRDTTSTSEVEALFVRALTETFLGDHEQAVALLDRVLTLRPNEPTVLLALAESYKALEQPTEALYYASEAVRYGPTEPAHYAMLAALQADANQTDDAIASYEALLRLAPADVDALTALGRLQERTGRYTDAIATYQRLLEIEGDNAALMLRLEALYARTGDPDRALRMLEETTRAFPDERMLLIRLGLAYRDAERLPEAADAFERLLALDPGDLEATQFLIGIAEAMGNPARADSLRTRLTQSDTPEDRLRQAAMLYAQIEANPDAADEALQLLEPFETSADAPPDALFMLGDLLYHTREYERTAAVLTRALGADPRKPEAWEQAAAAYLYAGQPEEALTTADDGLLLFPGRVGLLRIQGYGLAKLGRRREALRALDEALRILAEDSGEMTMEQAGLLSFKGVLHHELGEPGEAIASFEKALAYDASNALVLNNYAYVLAEQNSRLEKALTMARQAVASHPNNAYFLDTLGWVLFKLRRFDEAADAIEQAVAADDRFALLYEHLGDVYAAQGRTTEARTAWQRALDLDPTNEGIRSKLAER